MTDLTRILGKDRTTVYRWLRKGEIPGVLIDTTWIIYRDEVKDYLLSRHNQAGGAARALDAAQEDSGAGEQAGDFVVADNRLHQSRGAPESASGAVGSEHFECAGPLSSQSAKTTTNP
ncbi:UNVERIFIED_ORG: excisionase family DNA binding protein [Arthrobacter globiformis]|nr:excisionase family DNA binding protein [Arthrobacter globiformis]